MTDTNYFLGIDLGTTNSVISYINVTDNNKIIANIVSIPRRSDTGSLTNDKHLPSIVYYQKDSNHSFLPIVGDFAKAQFSKRPGYVVKSVKSSIGRESIPDINNELPDQKPEDVTAQIINQLLQGAKTKLLLNKVPDDVIITVPASFDGDQCMATLKAAEKAGVNAFGENGKPKNILLYEPKAVLYDIINSQMNGEIPKSIINLSSPKTVLVYDIGGGTLDVSLHLISQGEKGDLLNIEDLAISRYSQIGGDNFDRLIAEKLCNEFIEIHQGMFIITDQARKEITNICLNKAENLKIDMTADYEIMKSRGQDLPNNHEVSISEVNLYSGYPFERYISKSELIEIIKPLLGYDLTLESAKDLNKLKSNQIDNIIYPILDVIVKAENKCGKTVPIDYVVLNGGMSKFFPIIERLETFFNKKLIVLNDPDMSVAKGAAIYHYYLHKYKIQSHFEGFIENEQTGIKAVDGNKKSNFEEKAGQLIASSPISNSNIMKIGHIQNDTLNLEISGDRVYSIVPAGTPLPFKSKPLHVLMLPKDCNEIRLPFYYGSGNTTQWPNRKIAERRLQFKKIHKADTPISIQVAIDEFGIITVHTWITDKETELGTVTIAKGQETNNNEHQKVTLPANNQGIKVDFRHECKKLSKLINQRNNQVKNPLLHRTVNNQIKELKKRMRTANNPEDAGNEIYSALHKYNSIPSYTGILLGIGAKLYHFWEDTDKEYFHNYAITIIKEIAQNLDNIKMRDYHIQAINVLAAIGNKNDIPVLETLLLKGGKNVSPLAAVALAKIKSNPEPIIKLFLNTSKKDLSRIDSFVWAIGKLCSREIGAYNDIARLEQSATRIFSYLNSNSLNYNIKSTLLYAIGELCDCRSKIVNPISLNYIKMARECIKKFEVEILNTEYEHICKNKLKLTKAMINGINLEKDDNAQLLALRKRFDE